MRIGPGRISATSIGRAAQLQPERVRQPFHRVLGRRVGAAEAQIGETQDRGAVDDPAPAPFPHDAHRPARQLVRSEQVGPEDRLQSLVAEILHRAGQRVGAVVEQRVQRTVAAGQRLGHRGADRGGIGIVEAEALQPFARSVAQSSSRRQVARTRQPRRWSVLAASRPMPEEQPVMRTVFMPPIRHRHAADGQWQIAGTAGRLRRPPSE